MSEPVRVVVGDCRCPGSPHTDGDAVLLAGEATIPIGAAAHTAVQLHGGDPVMLQGALSRVYTYLGIVGWTFTDEKHQPYAIQPDNPEWRDLVDRLLPFGRGGYEVAEAGDRLYSAVVLRPLLDRLSISSRDGATADSTSPIPLNGHKPPKRSKRSSRSASADGRLSAVPAQ